MLQFNSLLISQKSTPETNCKNMDYFHFIEITATYQPKNAPKVLFFVGRITVVIIAYRCWEDYQVQLL